MTLIGNNNQNTLKFAISLIFQVHLMEFIASTCPTHKHWLFVPCKYGSSLHISSPNTKSRSRVPISVIGMHSTPSRMSLTAKFKRNTFVMVLIRRLCISVSITNVLPIMASNSIVMYRKICIRMVVNHDSNDVGGVVVVVLKKSSSVTNSVGGIKLGALSFIDSIQAIAIVSDVAFIEFQFSNGVIMVYWKLRLVQMQIIQWILKWQIVFWNFGC